MRLHRQERMKQLKKQPQPLAVATQTDPAHLEFPEWLPSVRERCGQTWLA